MKLPGFLSWARLHGYIYMFIHWSSSPVNKHGHAGIMIMSKVTPLDQWHVVDEPSLDIEARVIGLEYA